MMELSRVSKVYQGRNFEVEALRDVNLTIPEGQFISVVGKSGSGKSSLLKILGLLDSNFTGQYLLSGRQLRGAKDSVVARARRQIGYVFQDFQLIGRYTVRKNLEIASAVRQGVPQQDEVEACLDWVGLADKGASYPDELSGGQKQRAAVARAVIGRPQLIIADEPTGSLDTATARQVLGLLRMVHADLQCTLVLVTHDMDIALVADRVVLLVEGVVRRDVLRQELPSGPAL